MNIGIDITALQSPHRMRGIGATVINFINNIPEDLQRKHKYTLYAKNFSPSDSSDPTSLLRLDNLDYEIVTSDFYAPVVNVLLGKSKLSRLMSNILKVPAKTRELRRYARGETRIDGLNKLDQFIAFDQNLPLPSKKKVPTTLVVYDLIPLLFEKDYLWSYSTARRNHKTRTRSLLIQSERWAYKYKLKMNIKNAKRVIAISEHTKQDLLKTFRTQEDKIEVCHLGVSAKNEKLSGDIKEYLATSWGPIQKELDLKGVKYLLFIGGADKRRKIEDLVAAFNNLRGRGHSIDLVLAGDTMYGPYEVPSPDLQEYFTHTSYLSNVHFLGFVEEAQKRWLYQNALAFVYPSIYEGFGLPIIESMAHGTPVITYQNSSIQEVASDKVLYAKNPTDIARSTVSLLENWNLRKKLSDEGLEHSRKFSWPKTAVKIIQEN